MFQQGLDLLECDHFEEALQAFEYVVEQQPYNADALFHRGIALVNLGKLDEAIGSYTRAISIAPTEPSYHSHCGYALMIQGKLDAAMERFDYALELQPDAWQNKIYKACILADQKRLGAARDLLEEVLASNPDHVEALRHHAAVLSGLGEHEKALAQLERILARNRNHVESISRKATILMRLDRSEEALRCFREVVALSPLDKGAWLALLDLLAAERNWPAVEAHAGEALDAGVHSSRVYMIRGWALLELKQYERAILDLRKAREMNGRLADAHYYLARAYMECGRMRNALSTANRGLQTAPNDPRFLLLKASLHRHAGEYDKELQYLDSILEAGHQDFSIVQMRVVNLLARDRVEEALEGVQKYVALDPDHPEALLLCASLSERAGRAPAARHCYKRLLKIPGVDATAYSSYANFLLRRSEWSKALRVLNDATALFPGHTGVILHRAIALQSLGRHGECLSTISPLCVGESPMAEACWIAGRSYYSLAMYPLALQSFQTARRCETQCNGNTAPTFRCLVAEALTLYHLDRTHEGIALLERHAGQFEKFEREYYELLGDLYEAARLFAKAHAVYLEGVRKFGQSATLHYRVARTAAQMRKKPAMLMHLASALALDGSLITAAQAEPAFQRYSLSLTLNRLLGPAFCNRRIRMLLLYATWVVMVLALVLYGWLK